MKRRYLLAFFEKLPPCLIGIEACASSHHWSRELQALGHTVRLMPPAYVKPYVKRQKNDMADAEAICEAVTRTNMRFVPTKTTEQQSGLVLHRTRHLFIRQQTSVINSNLFEFWELGAKDLKGIAGPVRSFAALRASSVESRFEALHGGDLNALVGREEELELLLRRWLKVKTGEGQVVLISGEAGIGKSRLTAALLESVVSEPHTRLRYFCSPQHTDSAFHPIISQMERAAGFTHDDALEARLGKLDAVLAQTSTSKQDAALFADMLSLPNDGRYPALDLTPEQRRQRTLQALVSQMEALAGQNPVLMIFEDAHWSDATSLKHSGE